MARWRHRHSTDIDLFVEPDPYRHFQWNTGGRFTLDLTASASVDRLVIGDEGAYISFHGRGGHVSVAPARGLFSDPSSPDTVQDTHVPLETTAEILAKKLRFRMARDKELLPRDLYDLALARERDPPALRTALAALRNDQLGELLETFKDHAARGWPHTQPSLLAPSDPDLAGRSFAIVERLLRETLRQRPPERGPGLEITR